MAASEMLKDSHILMIDEKLTARADKLGIAWRQANFLNVEGVDENEAVVRWLEAVLGRSLPRPMHAALRMAWQCASS